MLQSRRTSFIESCMQTAIGFCVALVTQQIVFPWFDIPLNGVQNIQIAVIFTGVSLVRGYIVRRWFNQRLHLAAIRLAGDI